MSRPIVLRRQAQADFDDAADWYQTCRSGQGARFVAAVRKILADIQVMPSAHPVVHAEIREALVPRYPYAIYYQVEPGRIVVLAVFHTARDPAEWQRRN